MTKLLKKKIIDKIFDHFLKKKPVTKILEPLEQDATSTCSF